MRVDVTSGRPRGNITSQGESGKKWREGRNVTACGNKREREREREREIVQYDLKAVLISVTFQTPFKT